MPLHTAHSRLETSSRLIAVARGSRPRALSTLIYERYTSQSTSAAPRRRFREARRRPAEKERRQMGFCSKKIEIAHAESSMSHHESELSTKGES